MQRISIKSLETRVSTGACSVSSVDLERDVELRGTWPVTYMLDDDPAHFRRIAGIFDYMATKPVKVVAVVYEPAKTGAPVTLEVSKS